MGHVAVTLNGRTYRLACADGEESRLAELAGEVKGKLDLLVRQFGQAGEARLMLMAALLLADEMLDARAALSTAEAQAAHSLDLIAELKAKAEEMKAASANSSAATAASTAPRKAG